jgi:hypothetical protein
MVPLALNTATLTCLDILATLHAALQRPLSFPSALEGRADFIVHYSESRTRYIRVCCIYLYSCACI